MKIKKHTHVDENGHLRWGTLEKAVRIGILFFSIIGLSVGWWTNYKLLAADVRDNKQDIEVLEEKVELVRKDAAVTRNDIQYIKQGVERLLRKELGNASSTKDNRKTLGYYPINRENVTKVNDS